jgi:hypothetical protein
MQRILLQSANVNLSLFRKLTLSIFLMFIVTYSYAQPTVLGTELVNGSYSRTDLVAIRNFKQVRLQTSSSAASGARNWEFASGTAAATVYNPVWRPYSGGEVLSLNNFIPGDFNNGARYNTGGGSSGLLPAITSGNYYTFNVSNNALADNTMQLLETAFNPIVVSTVTHLAGTAGARTVTITMAAAPNGSEFIYVRYSTDAFATSTIVLATGATTAWTATIPAQSAAVIFYVYTSNKTKIQIDNDVTTRGQAVHDMSTLNLNNFGGSNYSYNGNITTHTAGAWNNGLPAVNIDATIAGAFTTDANFTAKSLTVNIGSTFAVGSGFNFTVANAITNNAGAAGFVVESNANLIQTGAVANTGNITVRRNTAMQRLAYTYWSSPVAAQQLLEFSPSTLAARFLTYAEATNLFTAVAAPGSTTFTPGVGYAIRAPNTFADAPATATAFTGTFVGVPNNGIINFTGTKTGAGHNLVGNPYPCAISTDTPTTGFFAQNTNVGTLYFWTKTSLAAAPGANYATQTTGGGVAAGAGGAAPNGTIQVGQGFFASLPTTAATITFNNGMKIGNNANQFFRNANTIEKHTIKLNLTTATNNYNQIAVVYMTGATSGVDNQIDGPTFGGGAGIPIMISSLINGENYAIQGRGLPFTVTDEVALGFKTDTAGNYTLSTASFDGMFAATQDFFLKDNLTGMTHNIKQAPYNFVSAVGTFNARFQLVYQNVLSISNPTLESSVVVYVKNDIINIKSNVVMTAVKIFDLRGRLVYEKSITNTNEIEINDLKTEHQVLLVQITADGKTATKKIIY